MEYPWEDQLLERKGKNDLKDLLKTMVAFANSVRPGHIAEILIGELDDGTAQGVENPDNIQKKVRDTANDIYPPIIWRSKVYQKDGKDCVRIEIDPSGDTPHFGGKAWVRKGSVTDEATPEMFQRLIELRTDKVHQLSQWLGKNITVWVDEGSISWGRPQGEHFKQYWENYRNARLTEVNRYWFTVADQNGQFKSWPLQKTLFSYDHLNDRLAIMVVFSGQSSE